MAVNVRWFPSEKIYEFLYLRIKLLQYELLKMALFLYNIINFGLSHKLSILH